MGLYLAVFDGEDDEVDGVEVGPYADFGAFRDAVSAKLEHGANGTRFPTLMNHSDCDGEWTPTEAAALLVELHTLGEELRRFEPQAFSSPWQAEAAKRVGLRPKTLADCFIDVDGEPLVERLSALCWLAVDRGLPTLFQ